MSLRKRNTVVPGSFLRWNQEERRPCFCLIVLMIVAGVVCVDAWTRANGAGTDKGKTKQDSPSIVLVTLDTTRRDSLGAYGNTGGITPNIDRLAEKAVVFQDARTQVPITLPSHTSILTGLEIHEHGVRENGVFTIDPSVTTLAEVLRKKGYKTAAFVSSFVLDRRFGLDQGFDVYDDQMTTGRKRNWRSHEVDKFERRASQTAERAISWIGENAGGKPFFLWVHFFDPHAPYEPPSEFAERFPRAYDGEVAYMDENFGKLMKSIDESGHEVLVVIASDHGESLGEHGITGHGHDLYEHAVRTVLIFNIPSSMVREKRPGQRVVLSDVGSTILDVVKIRGPFPGRSLKNLWEGGASLPRNPLYLETVLPKLRWNRSAVFGIIEDKWKLIIYPRDYQCQMFDIDKDPAELTNVVVEHRELAEKLAARLGSMVRAAENSPDASFRVPLDPDTEEKLRSLGYVGD